jgi:hypothetical protein
MVLGMFVLAQQTKQDQGPCNRRVNCCTRFVFTHAGGSPCTRQKLHTCPMRSCRMTSVLNLSAAELCAHMSISSSPQLQASSAQVRGGECSCLLCAEAHKAKLPQEQAADALTHQEAARSGSLPRQCWRGSCA